MAEEAGVGIDTALEVIEAGYAYRARSLTPQSPGQDQYEDRLVDRAAERSAEVADEAQVLRDLLNRSALPSQSKRILYLRFFGDLTQSEIGAIMGISQVHVSRLIRSSLAALKHTTAGSERQATATSRSMGA